MTCLVVAGLGFIIGALAAVVGLAHGLGLTKSGGGRRDPPDRCGRCGEGIASCNCFAQMDELLRRSAM